MKLFLSSFAVAFGIFLSSALLLTGGGGKVESDFCKEISIYELADSQMRSLKHTDDAVAIEKRRQESGRRVATMANNDILAGRPPQWCGLEEEKPDEATLIEIAVVFIQRFGLEKGSPDWRALTAAYNRVAHKKIV